ncbi:aldolase [Paenibacillus luteus]|uniref:aldolase n=1 Tax=Paenibacillus luteus TaxID=2545753 RepID=UPI0011414AA7
MAYKAFGLMIESELSLPELARVEDSREPVDVKVTIDSSLKDSLNLEPYDFTVDGSAITVMMPEAAVFRVEGGDRIIISPLDGADEDLIRLYVLGTCVGALLLQRSIYPLHGSAIAINSKAYAFVGHSGAGKSTLASAFISKGYSLLSDDVIALSPFESAQPTFVTPAYPQQKLWQQSLDAFGVKKEELKAIYGRETKFCIPVVTSFCSTALPLGGVFELSTTDEDDVSVQLVPALERLDLLFRHTYRNFLVQKLGMTHWHFNSSAKLAGKLPIYQLRRPLNRFTAPQLVELVLNTISAEV